MHEYVVPRLRVRTGPRALGCVAHDTAYTSRIRGRTCRRRSPDPPAPAWAARRRLRRTAPPTGCTRLAC
eukprot:3955321-Prymnesium_polylepis.1